MRVVVGTVFAALVGGLVVTCGGVDDPTARAAPCNGVVGPFTAPEQPPFVVHFGTAIVMPAPDWADGGICHCNDDKSLQLSILMTPDANACPADWIFTASPLTEDKRLLWLETLVPGAGPYTGTFTSTLKMDIATANGLDDALIAGPNFASNDTATIASVVFAKGYYAGVNDPKSIEYASGTITLTSVTPGVSVTGSFVADFPDGSISGSFDVPFCTTACGCPPYEPGMTAGFTCEAMNPDAGVDAPASTDAGSSFD